MDLEYREVWEVAVFERKVEVALKGGVKALRLEKALTAITWSPHTFHLTLWIVPVSGKPSAYNTGLPTRIVKRWQEYELPILSKDCLDKLTVLEVARDV